MPSKASAPAATPAAVCAAPRKKLGAPLGLGPAGEGGAYCGGGAEYCCPPEGAEYAVPGRGALGWPRKLDADEEAVGCPERCNCWICAWACWSARFWISTVWVIK